MPTAAAPPCPLVLPQGLLPPKARLLLGDGSWREMPSESVAAGDLLTVLPGDRVPGARRGMLAGGKGNGACSRRRSSSRRSALRVFVLPPILHPLQQPGLPLAQGAPCCIPPWPLVQWTEWWWAAAAQWTSQPSPESRCL